MSTFRKIAFILLTVTFCLSATIGQAQENDSFGEFLEKYFEGGEEAFLEAVYLNINYPLEARTSCGIGQLHVKIAINPSRGLKEIEFLNPFGLGVEPDVIQVLKKTNSRWKGLGEVREFEFSIGYQLCESPVVNGDVKVRAYSVASECKDSGCLSNESLLLKIKKGIEKEKYNKAEKHWDELIRRGCRSEEFLKLKEEYGDKFSSE